ncbi:vascular cell adhesion protein 1-like [Hyperolius riggenbachi]|uniref:vascular cell adhesion protein 1-like n=1 Tax=Hyperolius riggenbachi TaxID=752182 RepID=UPI0035A33093
MELAMRHLCLFLHLCGFLYTGRAQECQVQVAREQEFVPFGEWVLLNCTYTCSRPGWESRLQKRNTQYGSNWVSTEVLVNDWETSGIVCLADNDDGTLQKSTVTVEAYALPVKVTIDIDEELEEGPIHEVTCTVYDVAPVDKLKISAMKGSRVIDFATYEADTRRGKNTLAESLSFTVSRRDNLQDFYCQATLELETVEDNIVQSDSISVKTYAQPAVPSISVTPDVVKEGESLTLRCQSDGLPEPEYSWDVPLRANVTYSQDRSEVIIPKTTSAHNGTYTCMAKNQYGRTRAQETINIHEQPHAPPKVPHISATPGVVVKEGEYLTLTCGSDGIPEPEYTWALPASAQVTFSKDKSQVIVPKTTSAHKGTYECVAKNQYGRTQAQETIQIIGKSNGVGVAKPTALLLSSVLTAILFFF